MLSVITITFNNFEELKKTVTSISNQCLENVVINGGQCTKTQDFLRENAISCINERDKGISDAFNKGFNLAKGQYIAYLNSGDILIDKEYYNEAISILEREPEIGFVYADLCFEDKFAGDIKVRSGNSLPSMPFMHPTLIVRKSLMEKIGLFSLEYKIAMDLDFAYRLVRSKAKGHYIPRMVVRMDGGGISSTRFAPAYFETLKIIFRNRDFSLQSLYFITTRLLTLTGKLILLKVGGDRVLKFYRKMRYGFKP